MAFKHAPKEVQEALAFDIAKFELEFNDNYRAYNATTNEGIEEFEEARNSGCCGSFENSVVVNGHKWIYGCNHGH